ncbi:hypothetical protein HMPREF3187_00762 [Aerococcus christensenii]|uniref:Uncharacterized protein n=1 Tax=Aerococcus christensenii TaxID=87541 RepID=A0A133Y044_9LACT|nr:hypothetical protein HMPREF3187_00762 [Aerococcus christensenii]
MKSSLSTFYRRKQKRPSKNLLDLLGVFCSVFSEKMSREFYQLKERLSA